MFRARKELQAALIREARLEVELHSAHVQLEQRRSTEAKLERAELALDEKMGVLAGTMQELKDLEIKNAVLNERLDLLTNYFGGGPSTTQPGAFNAPNEEAEDLKHLFDSGQLNRSDYEDALAAAGLQNTTIEFAAADYPRLGS